MAFWRKLDRVMAQPAAWLGLAGLPAVVASIAIPQGLGTAVAATLILVGATFALRAEQHRRRSDIDALARSVGELNVRLAAARVKLDNLQIRVDSEPLREADIAPTRTRLSELTAEVGLLGGLLRDVAATVADQARQAETIAARAPEAAPGPAPDMTATPGPAVDEALRRRDAEKASAILSAFAGDGLELHLQPVATLPQRRTVGYEALARLRLADGQLLTPAEFIAPILNAGQGAALDAQVITRALGVAGRLLSRPGETFVGINLSDATWEDARALSALLRVLERYRAEAARLVVDVPQRIYRTLDPARLGVMGALGAMGLRFALDHVADLRLDPPSLADRGVRLVKVSPGLLLEPPGHAAGGIDIAPDDLASLLRRSGIELIGERVETDRQVADLLELDVRLAQGLAISPPRLLRPEAPSPTTPPVVRSDAAPPAMSADATGAETALAAPVPANPLPERVPFRATLRRA
jgi:cyclic-di-GMP phosphodiesterase TipF (flagellum assembly factor)